MGMPAGAPPTPSCEVRSITYADFSLLFHSACCAEGWDCFIFLKIETTLRINTVIFALRIARQCQPVLHQPHHAKYGRLLTQTSACFFIRLAALKVGIVLFF
jgi:hypothetical protein